MGYREHQQAQKDLEYWRSVGKAIGKTLTGYDSRSDESVVATANFDGLIIDTTMGDLILSRAQDNTFTSIEDLENESLENEDLENETLNEDEEEVSYIDYTEN